MRTETSGVGDWNFWTEGLDPNFFRRSYIRSLQVTAVIALMLTGMDQASAAVGLAAGSAVALFSTWTTEIMVRLLFQGGSGAGIRLAIGAIVKMPFLLGALLTVAWASYNGKMNAFGVVGGVLLVHAVMLFMVIGAAAAVAGRNNEKYR